MNQNCHRIVFNARRGQLIAVAETAQGQGKGKASGESRAAGRARPSGWSQPLYVSLLCAQGLLALPAGAQITALGSAPGNQKATVLVTGNDVPLVNVQTPSEAGVSRNTYSQFDVNAKGVILNNSRTGAQTELAGQVAGNPWMSRGTARVILNEVVSSEPSKLRGAIEIGGSRAELVIANPAGVEVNGAGFINASRATLTTGKPVLNGGSLEGYEVRQGTVTVHSGGLDASQTDYTALLARAVKVNGAIHAKELKVVTGANKISASHQQIEPIAGTGKAPEFALDVSELGGMYAGKITLIGTEAGIGVRNAGQIAASAGKVMITVDGKLINTGQISSQDNAEIIANAGFTNTGVAYSRGSIKVVTQKRLENSGFIGAQLDTVLSAEGDAGEIISSAGSTLMAGMLPDGQLADTGNLILSATQRLQASGTNRAPQTVSAISPVIDFSDSATSALKVHLQAIINTRRARARRQGENELALGADNNGDSPANDGTHPGIDARSATIVAGELFEASTDGGLRTDSARISASRIAFAANDLSNRGGTISQTGPDSWRINIPGHLDNTGGTILGHSATSIQAAGISNDQGVLGSTGTLSIQATGHLANGRGTISGAGSTQVEANSLDSAGLINGPATTRAFLNNSGAIAGPASAGTTLDNAGSIAGLAIAGTSLSNSGAIGGSASAGTSLGNSGAIGGSASAGTSLGNSGSIGGSASAGTSLGNSGSISGSASAGTSLGNSGSIGGSASAGTSLGNSGSIGGSASAGTSLGNSGSIGGSASAGTSLGNSGSISGSASAGTSLGNSGSIGGSASAGTSLGNSGAISGSAGAGTSLNNSGSISGSAGAGTSIDNTGAIGGSASAASINNAGEIGGSALAVNQLDNTGAIGTRGGDVLVTGAVVKNTGILGTRDSNTVVNAPDLDNRHGTILGGNSLLVISQIRIDNTDGVIDGGRVAIVDANSGYGDKTLAIANTRGSISGATGLGIDAASLSYDGKVRSQGDFSAALNGDYAHTAQAPFFEAAGAVALRFTGTISNATDWHVDKGLSLTGAHITNSAGGTLGSNATTVVNATHGTLSNQGLISGDTVVIAGKDLVNPGRVSATTLSGNFSGNASNAGGTLDIAGASVLHAAGNLNNDSGRIDSGSLDLQVGGTLSSRTLANAPASSQQSSHGSGSLSSLAGLDGTATVETTAGRRAGITARTGDLTLRVGQDLIVQGSDLGAKGNLTGQVIGDIHVSALALDKTSSQQGSYRLAGATHDDPQYTSISTQTTQTSHLAPGLSAGGDLSLIAGGNAHYGGTDITAGGQLTLGAVSGNLSVSALLDTQTVQGSQSGPGNPVSGASGERDSSPEPTRTVRQASTAQAVGGQLSAGGDITLLAGHDITLTGVSATSGGMLQAVAGHSISASSLASSSGQSQATVPDHPTGAIGQASLAAPQPDSATLQNTQHGGFFKAQDGIVFEAGLRNPFTNQASPQSGHETPGTLSLSGIDLSSGSPSKRTDISLLATGDVSVNSTWNTSTSQQENPTPGFLGLLLGNAAGSTTSTRTDQTKGSFQGQDIRIESGQGAVSLAGVRLDAAGDLLSSSKTDTRIDSAQLSAGGDLKVFAAQQLHISGLSANPVGVQATADTLGNHFTPTSAASSLTAGKALSLVGIEGISASGVDLKAKDIVAVTQGDLSINGGQLNQQWQGSNDQHTRSDARASTLQADTISLLALGENSQLALQNIALTSSGKTSLVSGGTLSIDPGRSDSFDYSRTSSSSGWLVKKTTTTETTLRTTTVAPSTLSAGELDIRAQGDITLTATQLTATQGKTEILSGGNINYLAAHNESTLAQNSQSSRSLLGLVKVGSSSSSHTAQDRTALVTELQSQSNVLSQSDGNTRLEGTRISSATGQTHIKAGQNLTIEAAYDLSSQRSISKSSSWGFGSGGFGQTTLKQNSSSDTRQAQGAQINGQTVLLQTGGDMRLSGAHVDSEAGSVLMAGNNLIVESAQNTASQSHFTQEKKTGLMLGGSALNPSVDFQRSATSQGASTSTTQAGSSITSANGPTTLIAQNGVLAVIASDLKAGADSRLTLQGAQVYVNGALNSEESRFEQTQKATNIHAGLVKPGEGFLSRGGLKGTDGQTTLAATTLSGGSISLQATGQPGLNPDGGVNLNSNPNAPSGIQLAGVKLSTPGQLRLDAGEGKLAFNLIQTTQSTSQESRQRDLTYQKAKGQGATSTQAEYNELSYGALVLSSPTVVVQHAQSAGTAGALTPASLSELSAKPGMGWIQDVQRQQAALAQTAQTDPAAALHIERVQLAHEQWDYKSQGLTQEGAVIVAVVVAYFTAGAGSSLVSAAAGTAGGGAAGATAGAAAGAGLGTTVAIGAAQASITTLATQASISLINNQGNIGKTLDELGSSASVKTLLTAIITGGVLGGMNFSPTGQPTVGGGAQSFTHQLGQNLQAGIARSLISTAINGGSLEDSLKGAITTAFIDTGAAQGAFAIGNMKDAGTLDAFTHKLAHALAGCAAGAASAGGDGCAPGAIGAALGEISAEAYGRKSDTVEFAAMISGIGAALAGGDASQISLASAAGANAAANNRMLHVSEEDWIKARAKDFSKKEGITEKEATERLTQQALKNVDYLWRAQLSDGDDAQAKAYLYTNQQTFRNDLGEQQKLFTTSGQQLFRPEMFADTANPAFYQQFVQSGISRSLASGLAKELQDSGIDLKNGAVDLAKAVKDNPALAVSAVWNAVKGLPQSVVDGFKETGAAIGEGSAVALNKDLSDKLNAIYGTDTAGAQKAILAIRILSATTGAAGTAKTVTGLSEKAAIEVSKKLDEVLDQKATQALIKSGGVMDKTGQPLLDLKQLTDNQKATMGDLLGSHTVRQIVPDGEKLARIQGVGTTGIDDLYKVSRPDLDYVVIEYKYLSKLDASGSSALSKTLDGKQGSETWITGSGRLEKAVGERIAPEVRRAVEAGRTETWVVRTYPDGATEIQVLDALGKPKPIDTSKIIISKMNLAGAKS